MSIDVDRIATLVDLIKGMDFFKVTKELLLGGRK